MTVSTRELIAAVDRASLIISDRLRSPLRLKFEENSLRITCTTSLGKAYDEVPLPHRGRCPGDGLQQQVCPGRPAGGGLR